MTAQEFTDLRPSFRPDWPVTEGSNEPWEVLVLKRVMRSRLVSPEVRRFAQAVVEAWEHKEHVRAGRGGTP